MITISESLSIPCEGIFWWIDEKLIALVDEVNVNDPFDCTTLTHIDTWNHVKNMYNLPNVKYDYFPRGRVETLVLKQDDGTIEYQSTIYLDKCINKKYVLSEVEKAFRLYLPNVEIINGGQLFIDGSHYTCNNCRQMN